MGFNEYMAAMFLINEWNMHLARHDSITLTDTGVEGWYYGLPRLFHCHR